AQWSVRRQTSTLTPTRSQYSVPYRISCTRSRESLSDGEPTSIAAHSDSNRVNVANALDGTVRKTTFQGGTSRRRYVSGRNRWPSRYHRTEAAFTWRIPRRTMSWSWTRPATLL